ncbi:hypothetical protein F511_35543 [Dorcoceras hygrometricum]|uniref:Uncharacterized protein n=1 Tax=Dorcoceras hygrometricum TaxID=472368 RepID=A0A2Z7CGP3_9LAMI|nr:hypothetical protein F511_35543 [Dorcoceras hygrometricum]
MTAFMYHGNEQCSKARPRRRVIALVGVGARQIGLVGPYTIPFFTNFKAQNESLLCEKNSPRRNIDPSVRDNDDNLQLQ